MYFYSLSNMFFSFYNYCLNQNIDLFIFSMLILKICKQHFKFLESCLKHDAFVKKISSGGYEWSVKLFE